jgi:hypothetical protein
VVTRFPSDRKDFQLLRRRGRGGVEECPIHEQVEGWTFRSIEEVWYLGWCLERRPRGISDGGTIETACREVCFCAGEN